MALPRQAVLFAALVVNPSTAGTKHPDCASLLAEPTVRWTSSRSQDTYSCIASESENSLLFVITFDQWPDSDKFVGPRFEAGLVGGRRVRWSIDHQGPISRRAKIQIEGTRGIRPIQMVAKIPGIDADRVQRAKELLAKIRIPAGTEFQ